MACLSQTKFTLFFAFSVYVSFMFPPFYSFRNLSQSLESLKLEMSDLTHAVEDKIINTARKSIDELQAELRSIQTPVPIVVQAEELKKQQQQQQSHSQSSCSNVSQSL